MFCYKLQVYIFLILTRFSFRQWTKLSSEDSMLPISIINEAWQNNYAEAITIFTFHMAKINCR